MATIADSEVDDIRTIWGLADYFVNTIKAEVANPVLFDLGCGRKKHPSFLGVDYYLDTDVKADLVNAEWDFTPDDSVDMFYSSHFIEHIPDLNTFMSRAWRKLKNGGKFLITTPYGFSVRAWQDPDHKRPIFRETYFYFNKQSRVNMGVEHYEGSADFDIVKMWPVWAKRFASRAEDNPELAEQYLQTFNAVEDLTVLLRARKEQS